MRCLAVAFACLVVPATVEARPSPYLTDRFEGDRYVAVRTAETTRSVKRPAYKPARAAKARYLYRTKARHRTTPVPARRAAPLTLAEGFRGEVAVAAGLPENLGSTRGVVIGGRPAGCPHRFCACALSIKLFGRIIPTLNLAANWMRFPRAAPGPGMVAARRGHVFKLLAHRAGNKWLVWDANSGRGRIRIHDRSIAGYVIVNPRGA